MALKATIYKARLELSDVDRGVYASPQQTLAQHPSETAERLVVRLLAFALRYADGLEFGRGVSTTDEPDVWLREGDGRVREWIEVGQPDAARLSKASRVAQHVFVFAYGAGLERWWEVQSRNLGRIENLRLFRVPDAFVASIASGLDRSIDAALTVSEGVLYWSSGDRTLEATLTALVP